MQGAHSIGGVGAFQVLISNECQHSARQWAQVTASGILANDAQNPDRIVKIERLRREIVETLEPFFVHPNPDSGRDALRAVLNVARYSDWYLCFSHPEIKEEILTVITRNLATARPN